MCDSLDKKVRLGFVDCGEVNPDGTAHVGAFVPLSNASDADVRLLGVYDLDLPASYGLVTSLLWNCICTSAGMLVLDRKLISDSTAGFDVVSATWIDSGGWKTVELRLHMVL